MTTQLSRVLSVLGAMATVLLGLLLLTASAAQAEPFAYIANSRSNNVSVIDTATNTVIATVPVGIRPNAAAVTSDGARVYVANSGSDTVSVIDTASNTVTATVFVGSTPVDVAVTPDSTRVYVANLLSNNISVINAAGNKVIATVSVGLTPFAVAVHPDGTRVYVTNSQSGTVRVIETASNTVVATVPVGTNLYGVAVNPAGTRVYVTNPLSNSISVIDTASNTVIATVPVGTDPYSVAVNPAGNRVYVTNASSKNVSVIDTASNTVTATIPMETEPVGFPYGVAVTPDGARVYVTNLNSNNVLVIETACNTVTATVAVGNSPYSLGVFIRPGAAPPPVIGSDLRITGMEVTQGIQDLANSVPLVSGRRTFVRVYVQSDGTAVPGVTATLSGTGSYKTIGGEVTVPLEALAPVNSVGPRITVRPSPKRSNLNDSFLFELPWTWTNFEALRLHAVLSANPGPPPQSCPADVHSAPLHELRMPKTLKIAFVRLGYQTPGVFPNVGASAQTSLSEQSQSESWIRRTFPLSEVISSQDFPLFDAGLGSRVDRSALECVLMKPDEQSLCAQRYITSRLAALQASSGFMGDAEVAYGLIPQLPDPAGTGLLFTRGACCTNRIGAGPSNVEDYAAHEIGHFLGRQHPVEGASPPKEKCGHDAVDPDYPYFFSFIAPPLTDPATGLAGFDGGDAGLSIPMSHISPINTYDIMGYCKPSWISDYTYKNLYICLPALNDLPGVTPFCGPAGDTRPQPLLGPQMGDWLMVFGNITPDPATAALIQTQRVDRIVSTPPRTPGSHSIRLLGAGGAILADYPFAPEAVEEGVTTEGASGPLLSFGHVVPFVAGTQEIQIVDASAGSTVIGAKTVSPNPPVIRNVTLQGDPVTGPLTLEWEASDPDGDPLEFDIFLMRDGGNGSASLQPLMLGLSDTSVQIDTVNLGGGIAQLRVVASDGVQSAYADTPSFTLTDKPPRPRILNPGDGTTIYLSQSVNLQGGATDPRDGVIPEAGLAWSLPGKTLGSGARLSVADLSVGINRITLTATNSVGLSDTASVDVTVKEVLDLPGPTLTAGPGQIGWNVGVGESQLQTAELDIGNSGSGNLEFTAHSSAPWLTLSPVTGTAPATLTVTADPSTFSTGVTMQATVTLTAVGIPGQVIRVPVSLAVGNTFTVGKTMNPVVNHAPTADAGPDQTVTTTSCSGATVTLDGSASSDPDGDPLTFSWTGPFGNTAGPNPTVELPLGRHNITLTIDDGRGASASDTLQVTVDHVVMFLTSTDAVTVPEGGTGQFQVKLSHPPCADVAVSVTRVSGDADITVQSGGTLTFTTSNWDTYQTVILNAAKDFNTANGTATILVSAAGIPNKDLTATEQYNVVAQPFPFFDDFRTDKGWLGSEIGRWERGPTLPGGGENGNPDPSTDYSSSDDNHILGFAIGADYPNGMEEKAIISPPIDCSGQDKVFLKFRRYLNVESSAFDKARIYVSNERGIWGDPAWENPPIDLTDNEWVPFVLDISETAAHQATVYIKFSMGPTNSAGRFSGWNIDDFEVTSEAIYPTEGTMGTKFTIFGSGFGAMGGKVLLGNTALKVQEWTTGTSIKCLLNKALAPGVYDMTIQPKGGTQIIIREGFAVKAAEIHSIEQGKGSSYDQVTIKGKFLGTKKGKVYLEYEDKGITVRKSCKVGKWWMDPVTNESEIFFTVPKMLPEVCDVVVVPASPLPNADEEDGFIVKAPEIISVDPGQGSVNGQITISGNFFGLKTPKVYLGYLSKGKPTKKSCSVVSWTDESIVFTVPALPGGDYEVMVTNSVGSAQYGQKFNIK